MRRKMIRAKLRKEVGAENMSAAWEKYQRKVYGKAYKKVCKKKRYDQE